MNKRSIILSIFFSILSFPVLADEVYALIVKDAKSSVYRVFTNDEFRYPIGYFFDCNKAQEIYVDKLKNFRLYSISRDKSFYPTTRELARQVFDGKAHTSNFGFKTQLLQDQREQIIPNSYLNPVYRPKGGFCSIDTGQTVPLNKISELDKEQQNIFHKDRRWYLINNGSWFQTWNIIKCNNKQNKTHLVFYEREEKKQANFTEEFWRGERPGKTFSRDIGKLSTHRLLRAKVSGALEIIDEGKELNKVWQKQEFYSICLFPDNIRNNTYSTYFYNWLESESGNILINGKIEKTKPIIESKSKDYRSIGVGYGDLGVKNIYVIGTDIFRNWLQKLKPNAYSNKIQADIIKFKLPQSSFGINVYIYSNKESKLFNFFVNNDKVKTVKEFDLPRHVQDFCISKTGDLYYAILNDNRNLEVETITFSEECHKLMPKFDPDGEHSEPISTFEPVENISGKIIFSQSFYENIYRQNLSDNNTIKLYSIFLHKKYYSQNFIVKKTTTEIFSLPGISFMELLKKSNSKISKLTENVDGFPDQYQKPQKVKLSIFNTKN